MRTWEVSVTYLRTNESVVIGTIDLTTCPSDKEILDTLISRGYLFDAAEGELVLDGDDVSLEVLLQPHRDPVLSLTIVGAGEDC